MDTEEAIAYAIETIAALYQEPGKEGYREAQEVLAVLIAIGNQRGCEHFDPALAEDGRLTTLIDLIVFG